jgi:hypothetical protein
LAIHLARHWLAIGYVLTPVREAPGFAIGPQLGEPFDAATGTAHPDSIIRALAKLGTEQSINPTIA